jgi:hypothetical protein
VGIADAASTLQVDRYSAISPEGVAVSFLNDVDPFAGWKVSLEGPSAWVRFDQVSFRKSPALRRLQARVLAPAGGKVDVRADTVDGPLLATIDAGKAADWTVLSAKLGKLPAGVRNLVVAHRGTGRLDLDWIRFE